LLADAKFSKQEIYDKVDPLNESQVLLDKQIGEIKRRIGSVEEYRRLQKEIYKTCDSYSLKLKNPDFEARKRMVRDWIKEINIMDDGSAKVTVRVPGVEGVILNQDSLYDLLNLNMDSFSLGK
jgi:regulator of replication initiation timing